MKPSHLWVEFDALISPADLPAAGLAGTGRLTLGQLEPLMLQDGSPSVDLLKEATEQFDTVTVFTTRESRVIRQWLGRHGVVGVGIRPSQAPERLHKLLAQEADISVVVAHSHMWMRVARQAEVKELITLRSATVRPLLHDRWVTRPDDISQGGFSTFWHHVGRPALLRTGLDGFRVYGMGPLRRQADQDPWSRAVWAVKRGETDARFVATLRQALSLVVALSGAHNPPLMAWIPPRGGQPDRLRTVLAPILGPSFEPILAWTRATATQKQVGGPERREANMRGALRAGGVVGRSVLVVDDVFTTGATLRAALHALVDGGARTVAGLALAFWQRPEVTEPAHFEPTEAQLYSAARPVAAAKPKRQAWNAGKPWNRSADQQLLEMWVEGHRRLSYLADEFGRTEGAIIARLAKVTGATVDEIRARAER